MTHPIGSIVMSMPNRDRQIAEELFEQGFSEEDLYAALTNKAAEKLLKPVKKQKASNDRHQ